MSQKAILIVHNLVLRTITVLFMVSWSNPRFSFFKDSIKVPSAAYSADFTLIDMINALAEVQKKYFKMK